MFSSASEIDDLCEYAINFLLTGQGDARRLAVNLARRSPDHTPLEVIFILSSAAAGIEEVLSGADSTAAAVSTWRIAALLGVELHMMQLQGLSFATCNDLMQYWQVHDPYFLS